ncbi:MAG TPA: hypothetical protein VEO01_07320 [Pseudonocardiaceae bacterium]|nr:hypothetical protein [Pseudonocardiaceae bacterium]
MSRTRRAAISLIVVALLCTGVTSATAGASSPTVDHHRLTHVHDFATFPMRLSPPTGTPRLTWQDAYRLYLHNGLFVHSRSTRMPLVELATLQGRGDPTLFPADQVAVWVVVIPDAEVVEFGGPDFNALGVKPPTRRIARCPAYVVFDANTGRSFGAFQTCDPPFRG